MLIGSLCFLAGIVSVQQLARLPEWTGFVLLLLLLTFSVWRKHVRWACFLAGMVWAILVANQVLQTTLSTTEEGKNILVQGIISELPDVSGNSVRFMFRIEQAATDLPGNIRLSWYSPTHTIKAGQRWRFAVKLKKPHGQLNPGGFDYESWLFQHRIGATGYVRPSPVPLLLADDTASVFAIDAWRQRIVARLENVFAGSEQLGLIKALTVGERYSLNQSDWEVLRTTGTAHLVAISGLHIGLVATIIYFCVRRIWARIGVLAVAPYRIAAIAAIIGAACYAALAGFSLPTQRALIMLTTILVAQLLQRQLTPGRSLGLALFGVLLFDPLSVMSAGFWLSFSAVALILYTLCGRLKPSGFWFAALKVHTFVSIGLFPAIMYFFQQVSLIAPLANFVAVPVLGFAVVPLLLIGLTLLPLSTGLAQPVLEVGEFILAKLWGVLAWAAHWPFASLSTFQPGIATVVWLAAGVMLLLAPRGFPLRYLAVFMIMPVGLSEPEHVPAGEVRLTLLDVGQGLAATLETKGHVLVFDTGAKYSDQYDLGASVVWPYLRFRRHHHIDTLLVSHGDNDHAGGAGFLLAHLPVKRVLSGAPLSFDLADEQFCRRGQQWRWDDVQFAILSPPQVGFFDDENDNSCVLQVRTRRHVLLLTGDIEKAAEAWLLDTYGRTLASDILIAPHHGSRTSSSAEFLRAVDPALVLIPAGYRNRYHFPHATVIERYKQLGSAWINTAEAGAVVIDTSVEPLTPESFRQRAGRYWHWSVPSTEIKSPG